MQLIAIRGSVRKMTAVAVLTATGTDRVGIVDDLSAALLQYGSNIEESRMALLGGEFALIALVSGTSESLGKLLDGLENLQAEVGLSITGKLTTPAAQDNIGRPYVLESVSLDTPGIVHSVTGLLRRNGINIDDLETETSGAPFTGAPMFRMRATVILPPEVRVVAFREDLDRLAVEQDLDLTLRPLSQREPSRHG